MPASAGTRVAGRGGPHCSRLQLLSLFWLVDVAAAAAATDSAQPEDTGGRCVGAQEGNAGTCAAEEPREHSSDGQKGNGHADVGRPFKWRGFPYRVTNPQFARTIYGGQFVRDAFREVGFEGPMEGEDWDLLWTHRPQTSHWPPLSARANKRLVNHCSYFVAAGDKCALSHYSQRVSATLGGDHLIRLQSYDLSNVHELESWKSNALESPERYWALKPCHGGASQGIKVLRGQAAVDALKELPRKAVAQEYLAEPYLGFGGRKFHLRLYVLITSWQPVVAHLYDGGIIFRSLKEYGVGRTPGNQDVFSSISGTVEGLSLADLWSHLDEAGGRSAPSGHSPPSAALVRARVKMALWELLGSDLQESFGQFRNPARGVECFDLLGADVILDTQLRPFVMEFNIGPNMWVDNHGEANKPLLSEVKVPMIRQVARWAAARLSRGGTAPHEQRDAIDLKLLENFTRLPGRGIALASSPVSDLE